MTKKTILGWIAGSMVISACHDSKSPDKLSSTEQQSYPQMKNASWLLGSWVRISEQHSASETWIKENDSTYTAESYILANNDTIFYETAILEWRNNEMHLIVKPKGQNDDQAVSFRMTSKEGSPLIFENPQHDFPTTIVYTRIGSDSLLAQISGISQGKNKTIDFPFRKSTSADLK